ncbi:pyruvate dehydrogenase complex dihydrolipoamide acetyltransferase [Microbacterium sp. NPDC096154]|uniref:pyruvate dehydrogenase complex dihydrolipoamide acetyltransferase n=1 Tax=Microbacterium sp. NPDC096154 TaxID=3155549 RepID=UPI0033320710
MGFVVRMPAVAAGGTEAAIQSWLVGVGDAVSAGQVIAEIETDKASVELEAEAGGIVAGILVGDGESAEVGRPIAVLAAEGQDAAAALAEAGVPAAEGASSAGSAPADVPPPDASPSAAANGHAALRAARDTAPAEDADPESGAPVLEAPPRDDAPHVAADQAADAAGADAREPDAPAERGAAEVAAPAGGRIFASPLVRRLAAEHDIDLRAVHGTGPRGRIVRRDIDALVARGPLAEASAARAAAAGPHVSGAAPTPAPDAEYDDVPHTGMRRAIARRLAESKATVPHFYVTADCRVDRLLALRAELKEAGVAVSVNDLVVRAVALALREVPEANAIWTDDAVRRFRRVDVAVAVAVPGGLLTPVVRDADRIPLPELSASISDLAARARDGRLKQRELEGGSFSVSNLGMYGVRDFAAIINPPHAGILAVGAAEPRAVVDDDGRLVAAQVMTVTLSADHRVVDGAVGAQWLAAFRRLVEIPLSLLL